MRVLMVTLPEPGHLHPVIGIAQHLEHRGHDVAVFAATDTAPRLRAAGLRARAFSAPPISPPRSATMSSAAYAEHLRDVAWARRRYRVHTLSVVRHHVVALRAAVDAFRPDVVSCDPFVYAGPIVAAERDVPWAAIASGLVALSPPDFRCCFFDLLDEQTAERDALFATFSFAADCKHGELRSPWLNTVFTTEAFVPRSVADNDYSHYVGPAGLLGSRGDEPAFPWERLREGLPLIYVSFGSQLSPPARVFQAITQAFAPGEVQLVVSVNDQLDDPIVRSLRDDVIVVRYAPQLRLLDRAAAMITHGGFNAVSEAISRGVPMVVIPIGHDQPLQAHFVATGGLGSALAVDDATVERCRTSVEAALGARARMRVEEVRRSFRDRDGAAEVTNLLEELARTRTPIPPAAGSR